MRKSLLASLFAAGLGALLALPAHAEKKDHFSVC